MDLNTINECHEVLNSLLRLENTMRFLHENLTTAMVFQLPRACDVCHCGLETMSQYLGVDITFLKHKLQHVKSKISIQWLLYALRDHLGTLPVALLIISQEFEKVAYVDSNFEKHSLRPIDIYFLLFQSKLRIQIFIMHKMNGGGPYLIPCTLHPLEIMPELRVPNPRIHKEFRYDSCSYVICYRRSRHWFSKGFVPFQRISVVVWCAHTTSVGARRDVFTEVACLGSHGGAWDECISSQRGVGGAPSIKNCKIYTRTRANGTLRWQAMLCCVYRSQLML